jgi:hypothetical protein
VEGALQQGFAHIDSLALKRKQKWQKGAKRAIKPFSPSLLLFAIFASLLAMRLEMLRKLGEKFWRRLCKGPGIED